MITMRPFPRLHFQRSSRHTPFGNVVRLYRSRQQHAISDMICNMIRHMDPSAARDTLLRLKRCGHLAIDSDPVLLRRYLIAVKSCHDVVNPVAMANHAINDAQEFMSHCLYGKEDYETMIMHCRAWMTRCNTLFPHLTGTPTFDLLTVTFQQVWMCHCQIMTFL